MWMCDYIGNIDSLRNKTKNDNRKNFSFNLSKKFQYKPESLRSIGSFWIVHKQNFVTEP